MSEEKQVDWSDPDSIADLLVEPEEETEVEEEIETEVESDDEEEMESEDDSGDADGDEEEEVEEEDDDDESEAEEDDSDDGDEEVDEISDETILSVNGEEVAVKELKDGYLRMSDYTKKNQDLAEKRTQIDALEKESVAYLTQDVSRYQKMLDDAQSIDMVALAEKDPRKYSKVRAQLDLVQNKVKEETKKIEEWHIEYQKKETEKVEAEIAEAMPIIKENITDWSEQKGLTILNYAVSLGMPEEKAKALTDPHLIIALEKARRFDAAKQKVSQKKKSAPKAIRNKASVDVGVKESKARAKIRNQISQTSDPDKIADLLTQLSMNE